MRSKHHLKDELLLCLREMTEGNVTLSTIQVLHVHVSLSYVDDESELESMDWTKFIDRGGLIRNILHGICYNGIRLSLSVPQKNLRNFFLRSC